MFQVGFKTFSFLKYLFTNNLNRFRNDIVVLIIFLILSLLLFISLDFSTEQIIPFANNSGITFNTSHEEKENFSEVSSFHNLNGSIGFKYRLSDQIEEPFVGLFFHKNIGSKLYFDYSKYDQIFISLSSTKGKRIPVYITIDFQDLKSKKSKLLAMPLRQVIDYTGAKEYQLKKSEFEIPSWWLRYHGISKEMIKEVDYSKVNYILINSCQILNPSIEDTITIHSIRFANSNKLNYIIYGVLIFILTVIYIFLTIRKTKKVLIPYQIDEIVTTESDTKIQRIAKYIAQNFSNSELSSNDIHKALGISTREIGVLIKDEYGISFKAYLNMIRLHELKRLLKETDLPISEIAYQMGYNNISHFNRLFKEDTGKSPKEYRENV